MLGLLFWSSIIFADTRGPGCNGYYKSPTCTHVLFFDHCKQQIKVFWRPLEIPGNIDWARTHRNWCSVTYEDKSAKEEVKFKPEKCDEVLKMTYGALQGFPEAKASLSTCSDINSEDGVLYSAVSGRDPIAVRIEDLSRCSFWLGKKRNVQCPILSPRVQEWLSKFLSKIDVELKIKNPVR